jgi:hypothetical protein
LATEWGTNAGCGGQLSDAQLNQFFASLPPHSLVRFWAFQGTIATNVATHQIDWAPLDRVFAAAAANGQLLIPVLTDQGGTCDGDHWQDPAWFDGGFTQVFNSSADSDGLGLNPLSYWNYLQQIVNRYKGSPALGMWEPISEANAATCPFSVETDGTGGCTCPDESVAAQSLRHFFDVVGGEIHALDPIHLVESGLQGGGMCGTQGSDYGYVSASPGIDVMSYHDYYGAAEPLGGPPGNGIQTLLQEAAALGKPIIGGEVGLMAGSGACMSDSVRARDAVTLARTQIAAGSSGLLWWDWMPNYTQPCNWDIGAGDPLISALSTIAAG